MNDRKRHEELRALLEEEHMGWWVRRTWIRWSSMMRQDMGLPIIGWKSPIGKGRMAKRERKKFAEKVRCPKNFSFFFFFLPLPPSLSLPGQIVL